MYAEGHPESVMIPLSLYERHLLELWYECGSVAHGANGLIPLEWDQIEAWSNMFYSETYVEWLEHPRQSKRHKVVHTPIPIRQCTLLDSELKLIRILSQEYSNEYAQASEPNRPCPKETIDEEVPEVVAEANADNIIDGFRNLFAKQEEGIIEVVPNK